MVDSEVGMMGTRWEKWGDGEMGGGDTKNALVNKNALVTKNALVSEIGQVT